MLRGDTTSPLGLIGPPHPMPHATGPDSASERISAPAEAMSSQSSVPLSVRVVAMRRRRRTLPVLSTRPMSTLVPPISSARTARILQSSRSWRFESSHFGSFLDSAGRNPDRSVRDGCPSRSPARGVSGLDTCSTPLIGAGFVIGAGVVGTVVSVTGIQWRWTQGSASANRPGAQASSTSRHLPRRGVRVPCGRSPLRAHRAHGRGRPLRERRSQHR